MARREAYVSIIPIVFFVSYISEDCLLCNYPEWKHSWTPRPKGDLEQGS